MQRGLVFTTSLLLKRLKTVISSALRGAFLCHLGDGCKT